MARRKLRPRKATKGGPVRCSLPTRGKATHTSSNRSKCQRYRPGTAALRDVRRYEKSTDLLLLREPFARLVRELLQVYNPTLRFQPTAVSF